MYDPHTCFTYMHTNILTHAICREESSPIKTIRKVVNLYLSTFFRTGLCKANVVRARATKLGIILLSSSFFFLPHTFLPEGVCLGN